MEKKHKTKMGDKFHQKFINKDEVEKESNGFLIFRNILFIIGLFICFLALFIDLNPSRNKILITILLIVGILIGIINVLNNYTINFAIASIVLVIIMPALTNIFKTSYLSHLSIFLQFFAAMILPASLIIIFKLIFSKDKKN